PVVVLGHALWQTQYGGRRDIIDSTIQIGPTLYTIIGVAPKGFVGLWPDKPPAAFIPISSYATSLPMRLGPKTSWWTTYSWTWAAVIARRRPGVSIEQANADLSQAFLQSYEAQRVEQPGSPPTNVTHPHGVAASIIAQRGPN